jgi:hypothetical protein
VVEAIDRVVVASGGGVVVLVVETDDVADREVVVPLPPTVLAGTVGSAGS